jgi:hypothetical protein
MQTAEVEVKKLLLTGVAALFLATGATAAGVDYVCGPYTIIIEPKDRTYTSHQQTDPMETIVSVPKGITSYGDTSGDKRTVKSFLAIKKVKWPFAAMFVDG